MLETLAAIQMLDAYSTIQMVSNPHSQHGTVRHTGVHGLALVAS
jgi:hypothetical protein